MALDPEIGKSLNTLGDNCFQMSIKELPMVSLFCQSVTVPGITLGTASRPTGNVDYRMPGDKLEYEDLIATFIVDENLENFREVWNWMAYLGFPRHTNEFKNLVQGTTAYQEVSDIILTTTTNKFNPNKYIKFVDAFPTNLSELSFVNNNASSENLTATVIFNYSYYYFTDEDDMTLFSESE